MLKQPIVIASMGTADNAFGDELARQLVPCCALTVTDAALFVAAVDHPTPMLFVPLLSPESAANQAFWQACVALANRSFSRVEIVPVVCRTFSGMQETAPSDPDVIVSFKEGWELRCVDARNLSPAQLVSPLARSLHLVGGV